MILALGPWWDVASKDELGNAVWATKLLDTKLAVGQTTNLLLHWC